MDPQPPPGFFPRRGRLRPRTGLGGMAPVQRHREPFRLDVNAGGRLGPGPLHDVGDQGLPGPGVGTHMAQAVQADERDAGG